METKRARGLSGREGNLNELGCIRSQSSVSQSVSQRGSWVPPVVGSEVRRSETTDRGNMKRRGSGAQEGGILVTYIHTQQPTVVVATAAAAAAGAIGAIGAIGAHPTCSQHVNTALSTTPPGYSWMTNLMASSLTHK
eukprot:GHVU01087322.1.p1 GENE.GHVU01087322.1~~GHVU01087322.1.p1  ORF type:complete len:137 (+),score=23.38 GHVU01087322.1:26-436(+)